jgi:prepilin-type N-terminal cleavage/methylation domain-containing protein
MYREDSDLRLPGGRSLVSRGAAGCRGFTLMEVTVALVASGIVLVGLARFFKDFNRSFNSQEQVSDRDLNAHYAVKRLSEAVMSAGSSLPSRNWDSIITFPDGNANSRLSLGVNPRGGIQYLSEDITNSYEVDVDDAKGFAKATAVLADPQDPDAETKRVRINQGYNDHGFENGVKTTGQTAILRLDSKLTLKAGDAIYAYDVEEYRLTSSGDLTLNGMVLAENIQSLTFTAYASNQTPNGLWSSMRSMKIQVTARTRNRDPNLAANGGYRTIDLSMDVLLRNRL